MTEIREFKPSDTQAVGRLIFETYGKINLAFIPAEDRGPYLGPFQHAYSSDPEHQKEIAGLIDAPIVYVAKQDGKIVGVLRGSPGRLHSLFVDQTQHQKGIGRKLHDRFEAQCREAGAEKITLASTLFAVPFYQKIGYKKSTGVRRGSSFNGEGFKWQPMKKLLIS